MVESARRQCSSQLGCFQRVGEGFAAGWEVMHDTRQRPLPLHCPALLTPSREASRQRSTQRRHEGEDSSTTAVERTRERPPWPPRRRPPSLAPSALSPASPQPLPLPTSPHGRLCCRAEMAVDLPRLRPNCRVPALYPCAASSASSRPPSSGGSGVCSHVSGLQADERAAENSARHRHVAALRCCRCRCCCSQVSPSKPSVCCSPPPPCASATGSVTLASSRGSGDDGGGDPSASNRRQQTHADHASVQCGTLPRRRLLRTVPLCGALALHCPLPPSWMAVPTP